MYECFNCGQRSVIWQGDFMFDEYGREGYGIVHTLRCTNCGADIDYYVPLEEEYQNDSRRHESNITDKGTD